MSRLHIEAEFLADEEASVSYRGFSNTFIVTVGCIEMEVTPEHIAQLLRDLGVDRECAEYPL